MTEYSNVSNGAYGNPEGDSNATKSMIFAIVGVFIFGIILGPLAIFYSKKATPGTKATVGKVLGWIVTVLSVLTLVALLFSGFPGQGA